MKTNMKMAVKVIAVAVTTVALSMMSMPHQLFGQNTFPSSGNVGIGTTTPAQKLVISGGSTLTFFANTGGDILSSGYIRPHINGGIGYDFTVYSGPVGGGTNRFQVLSNGNTTLAPSGGNVGIGTFSTGSFKLAVEGKIGAREVNVMTGTWADFVFKDDYKLKPLDEVEKFIEEHKHLPEVQSEEDVKANGVNLGETQALLLQKVEELTLYLIEQNKQLAEQNKKMDAQNGKLTEQNQKLEALSKDNESLKQRMSELESKEKK